MGWLNNLWKFSEQSIRQSHPIHTGPGQVCIPFSLEPEAAQQDSGIISTPYSSLFSRVKTRRSAASKIEQCLLFLLWLCPAGARGCDVVLLAVRWNNTKSELWQAHSVIFSYILPAWESQCFENASIVMMNLLSEAHHVFGGLLLLADLHHKAVRNHFRCAVWCCAPLCGSVQQPCEAGPCRSVGERTGCHHCCVFKNSLQAAFQITSAAN